MSNLPLMQPTNSIQNIQNVNLSVTVGQFFHFMENAFRINNNYEGLTDNYHKTETDSLQKLIPNLMFENLLDNNKDQNWFDNKNTLDEFGMPNKDISCLEMKEIRKETVFSENMKQILSDILHEGLLDSVLSFMIPRNSLFQPLIKKPITNWDSKKSTILSDTIEHKITSSAVNVKDITQDKNKTLKKNTEIEVEIHVCDEAKNIKKDFHCPQKLLVQKMCYFAEVTAGQKLEEIDISVHCDIVIFDWLMRWVKKDIIKKSEWPILEASNVIPIMVSASFLQMEPLLENCLEFCQKNMSEILKTSTVLTCLNDNLLTRLANLFTNEDVENLKDKKDKIQSRLFCKFIIFLSHPVPDSKKGHFSSLATLFKCSKCGKNITQSLANSIPCNSNSMHIDNEGNIYSQHTRDFSWTLSDYILTLRSELRSWRKVYWKLWGDCHYLYCQQCEMFFPINQMGWCCYHPELPQFFVNEQQRPTPYPLGRYPCCSQRAYRFEILINREGCRYKEHLSHLKTENDVNILNIFNAHKTVISIDPPQLFFPEKITRLVARDPSLKPGKLSCKEVMWWNGLEIVPSRMKLGLLAKMWGQSGFRKLNQDSQKNKIHRQVPALIDTTSYSSSITDSDDEDVETVYNDSSVEEESYFSEESNNWSKPKSKKLMGKKIRNPSLKRDVGRCWNTNLVVRYNQDNQRDFEEKATAQMISFLTKRITAENYSIVKPTIKHSSIWKQYQSVGGSYVKLEAEFREQWQQSCKYKNSTGKSTKKHL